MTEISTIRQFSLDKLIVDIDGTSYPVVTCKLGMKLNAPGTCEITLANGVSIKRVRTLDPVKAVDGANAFTKVSLYLYADSAKDGLVIFRGFVTSVNRLAAKNPAGSFTGVVLNCTMPPMLSKAYSSVNYKYWADRHGRVRRAAAIAQPTKLSTQFSMEDFNGIVTSSKNRTTLKKGYVKFLVEAAGAILEKSSNKRYLQNAILVHFERRGRTVKGASPLSDVTLNTDFMILRNLISGMQSSDPLTAIRAVAGSKFLMHMVPLMCGKMDIFPSFPWDSDIIATITAKQQLKVRDTTRMNAMTENVDGIYIPLMAGGVGINNFAVYPPVKDLPATGIVKGQGLPSWLSPFLFNAPSTSKTKTNNKSNKSSKRTNEELQADIDAYKSLAVMMAEAFFTEIKNGGVSLDLELPWYRLEFLDALGYVIKIEHPYISDVGQTDDLYGMIVAGSFVVQSTPGGSKATLNLQLSHVRDAELHEEYAREGHPMYNISGGPKSGLKKVADRTFKIMTRSEQTSIEGGSQDGYLDEAVSEARNKK